ncbi:MAG: hypothetical protein HN948_10965 [Clostridia bacterium]|nr:hypothetical protein [Clostridia bacterium]MBT7123518.1 hypothetical protein [Clostridia bacterium]
MIEKQQHRKLKFTKKAILVFSGIFVAFAVLITGIVLLATRSRGFEETVATLPFEKDESFVAVGNSVVYLDNDLLICVSASLDVLWQKRLLLPDLKLVSRDGNVAATGSGLIQIVNSEGTHLFSTQLDGDIISSRVCANKVAVYVEQGTGEETLSYIISFDLSGIFLHQIDVTDRYILDYGFDYDSDLLYLLELDTSGVAPISRISTFRPETQSMTSVKEFSDQLVDQIYIIDETVYVLGTYQLVVYTSLGDNEKELVVYGWMQQDFYLQGDPSFVYIPSNTDAFGIDIVRIIKPTGSETTINLPPDVFRVLYIEDKVYCFSQTNVFIYTNDGKFLRSLFLPFSITEVDRAFANYVFLSVGDKMYLMPLS